MKADHSHESLNLAVTSGCPSAGGEGASALRVGSLPFQAITKIITGFYICRGNRKAPKILVLIINDREVGLKALNRS